MSKSHRLGFEEVRRVFRLVGHCRDVGHDFRGWLQVAVGGLREQTGAVMACVGHLTDWPPVRPSTPGIDLFDVGWGSPGERAEWLKMIAEGRHARHLTAQAVLAIPGELVVRSRSQVVPDPVWKRCAERNDDSRRVGQDDTMIALNRISGGPSRLVFSLNRALGERAFHPRERAFLRLFCRELFALPAPALVRNDQGPLARLSPRSRDVLLALVEGDGEKQVALRLGISKHRVHDLVKALYRAFGVSSRAELIAAYYRRRLTTRD